MLVKETVDFLKRLEKNNDREWFNANKDAFVRANDNVIAVTGDLIGRISKFDPTVVGIDPKSCVFRIYRDVRFSKDKEPIQDKPRSVHRSGRQESDASRLLFSRPTENVLLGSRETYAR